MNSKMNIRRKYYVERDLSWMYFNRRILCEAAKEELPLLERLTFLGIYSNNLDEFFRVRVAALERVVELKSGTVKAERDRAKVTLKQIEKLNLSYHKTFDSIYAQVVKRLAEREIYIANETQLSEEQQSFVRHFFYDRLNGSTNPLFLSKSVRIDYMTDEDIYLCIRLTRSDNGSKSKLTEYAVIGIPTVEFGRFITLPDTDGVISIIFLDDIIRYCLPLIFAGTDFNGFEAYTFKFTKNAEMEIDSELSVGVLQRISKALKARKKGESLRLVYDADMPRDMLLRLRKHLNMDRQDTYLAGGRYHNMKDLMQFPHCDDPTLKYAPLPALIKPELYGRDSVLDVIRKRDAVIHTPYHSFDMYIRLLREAAIHPAVKSISTSVYRLAKNSKVIETLIAAARNGKKVTVVIELLARFDEASNIDWSKRMQEAGIRVVFGVEGLKVHSKITHIGCTRGDIACISTGNFHEGNARVYTDYTLMTAHRTICREVARVFNFIDKPYLPETFKELLVSPNGLRAQLTILINREAKYAEQGKPAYIMAKLNHITDTRIIDLLYKASCAGVRIDLLVRGNCSIIPGIPGVSDRIRIHAIIDRFLEHSRLMIFGAGGEEKCYIGSADWMPRNLDNRIEVMVPIYDERIKQDIKRTLQLGMNDTDKGYIVDGKGANETPPLEPGLAFFRSQMAIYELYKTELEQQD